MIVDLAAGDDGINSIKQAVQFGLDKQVKIAGMQQELEVLEGLPPEARIGSWLFEWYWNQPNVPHVAEFVAAIRKKTARCRPRALGSAMWRLDLRAGRQPGKDARRRQAGPRARGLQASTRGGADAGQGVLSGRGSSAGARPVRRPLQSKGPTRRICSWSIRW